MKILTIIGARPQFIKAAALSRAFKNKYNEIIVHTGQHYDFNMSELFFVELGIPVPKYNLNIGSGNHGEQTGNIMIKLERVLDIEKPDGIVLYGDTNSTLAGALVAAKLHYPVFHVEAGLRSFNKSMPEEINRVLTDHISSLLFCPTKNAVKNLEVENITNGVFFTGDIMFDSVVNNIILSKDSIINELDLIDEKFLLLTIHRASNTRCASTFMRFLYQLDSIDLKIIFPIHPRTLKIINKDAIFQNIVLISPVGYLDMIKLISESYMVVTDSGGLQKEAFFLKTPCTTIRTETEWIETLVGNVNILVDINDKDLEEKIMRDYDSLAFDSRGFGDGKSALKMVGIINEFFKEL